MLSNTFSDTTQAISKKHSVIPLDLVGDELWDFQKVQFKEEISTSKLQAALEQYHEKVPFILITIINNLGFLPGFNSQYTRSQSNGPQFHKPVYFCACRFAENAYFY